MSYGIGVTVWSAQRTAEAGASVANGRLPARHVLRARLLASARRAAGRGSSKSCAHSRAERSQEEKQLQESARSPCPNKIRTAAWTLARVNPARGPAGLRRVSTFTATRWGEQSARPFRALRRRRDLMKSVRTKQVAGGTTHRPSSSPQPSACRSPRDA